MTDFTYKIDKDGFVQMNLSRSGMGAAPIIERI